MANTCLDSNLLAYSGASQLQRILKALYANYAAVDERSAADLILFAKNYAAYLNYYNGNNEIEGDWQPFMANDAAVIIAGIANWETKNYIPFVDYVNAALQSETDDGNAQNLFKTLFDFAFTLATNVDDYLYGLTDDIPFKNYLSIAIASNLALPLNAMWQYYNDFKASGLNLINESVDYADAKFPVDNIVFSEEFNISNLKTVSWQVGGFAAPGITLDTTAGIITNIDIIITHNLFTGALQSLINGVIKIVADAPAYLDDVLKQYSSHQPHYALYLAFLRLLQFAQKKINNYTQEHLDFYYKKVLQLSNAAAVPDFVHLLFELQKNTPDHILKKGTAFKAGKDADSNELFYTLTDDVVLHAASVQLLKSLYLNKNSTGGLYASPVANSNDGNGAKLSTPDNSWFVFGDVTKISKATTGFAIASNVLYLNEGARKIAITFLCEGIGNVSAADLTGIFTIQFTGKKKWYDATSYTASTSGNSFILEVSLDGDDPPIIPYSQKIHGGSFEQSLPMVQVMLNNYKSYQKIKALKINSIEVEVTASVKDLNLQNDDGKINTAKPFKAFGEFPESGAALIIGNKEVFQKPLTELVIHLEWQNLPGSTVKANIRALKQGVWTGAIDNDFFLRTTQITIAKGSGIITGLSASSSSSFAASALSSAFGFSNSASSIFASESDLFIEDIGASISGSIILVAPDVSINGLENVPVSETDFTSNEDYSITSTDGFIRIQLNSTEYSLAAYLSSVQDSVKNTSTNITEVTNDDGSKTTTYKINPPATIPLPSAPVIKSIYLDYTAKETIAFNENTTTAFANRTAFYYHLEPFGFREMHPFLTADGLSFLPVFNLDNGISKDDGGELWIGLKNAAATSTYSILFQVADGTSNPLKPMTVVSWYYLSANNWVQFDKLSITDQTNNLTRSGIVTVNIPSNIITGNTRAENDLLWIKAVTDHGADAVCKLIAVVTNAAKATFLQDASNNIFFTKALAPNIISKPAVADAALKKTNQPYASFDGKTAETNDQFYIRVSERLRHKHRAVTGWDYERLVLQNYSQVHKVKCINHTGLITDKNNITTYSETLPGHVTVVTIPDLKNNTSANALRPYTSVGLLTEIQQYLEKLNSKFVRLHVLNPQFEEVQFDFTVSFMPNRDATVYSNQLSLDIEQFLTPWAFDTNSDIEFGGSIEKSVVLNFVEERKYVDYVTCFKMNHIIRRDGETIIEMLPDIETAVASTARSIMVSYNDGKNRHLITSSANCNCND